LEHFQARFSRFEDNSVAITPGKGFGFAEAKAGFTGTRIERVMAREKNRMCLFILSIFPYLLILWISRLGLREKY
jgi:hypothetical protein